ncbi:hypothetical protein HYT25_01125 [Candidatus Pacearchaeota archaeon]|nr:hypothetical protein [Candidatus Pacearchaeota archaeon]
MINEIRLRIAEFLGTKLIDTNYLFIDYWTFLHFAAGFFGIFLMYSFFKKTKTSEKFIILFLILFFWEIFEIFSPLIKEEKTLDIIYDLIIGMIGGYSFYYLKQRK